MTMSSYAASDLGSEHWHLEPKSNDKNRLRISLRRSSRSSQASSLRQTDGTNASARRWNGQWSNLELDPSVAALLSAAPSEGGQILRNGPGLISSDAPGDPDKTVARVKQTTKGFIIRLLKGVTHPVQEIHLQHIGQPDVAELPSYREAVELGTYIQEVQIAHRAELDAQALHLPPRSAVDTREREEDRPIDVTERPYDDTTSIMESELEASLEEQSRERQLLKNLGAQPQHTGELSPATIRTFVSPTSGPLGEQFMPSSEYTVPQPEPISSSMSLAQSAADAKVDVSNFVKTKTSSLEPQVTIDSFPTVSESPNESPSSHPCSSIERIPALAKPVDWVALLSEPNVRRNWTLLQRRKLFRRNHVQFKRTASKSVTRIQARGQVLQRAGYIKMDNMPAQELEKEGWDGNVSMIERQSLEHTQVRSLAAAANLFITFAHKAASAVIHVTHAFRNWAQSEPPVSPGNIRVRWLCSCGQRLFDDFQELHPGAARKMEMKLNHHGNPRMAAQSRPSTDNSSSSGTNNGNSVFSGGSFRSKASSATSVGSASDTHGNNGLPKVGGLARASSFHAVSLGAEADVLWLLACVPEGRFTPKLAHVSMDPTCVKSDRDVALALKERYTAVHKAWYRFLKLRGLKRVDFVQFEVHRNRFTDIRARPDMPQADSKYEFEVGQLVPPVGTHYLLHLMEHPEDYETESIFYQRCPKKRGKLDVGVGWGVELVEEFMPARVWAAVVVLFLFSSIVFAIVWVVKKHDVQGAFAVTAWMCMFSTLVLGWIQACVE